MNRNLYRVIFSAARGLWVAVQETAVGLGKGRTTGTPGAMARPRAAMIDMLPMRELAFAALCVLGMQPVLVDAQVVPLKTGAGSVPVVGVTASGMPVVQIATPNGAGVSNNNYTSFNVGTAGLILNNSPANVLTQQAGYVAGNPNLVPGNSAHVIVNQVVGGTTSQLLGYMEVAGPAADVVVANPAGIYCNGCGFINTNRGVLTTGTPVFGGSGSLDAFHVTGGQIQIGSSGLNAGNIDEVDLIARSVQVNGQIWANQSLNVVAGTNDVQYGNLATTALTPDANHPAVAIDVAQLGGMYAGKIALVGTEAGVGVNSTGTIAAQSGDVSLSNNGAVTLAGQTSASGNVSISGTSIGNTGAVYASQNTTLSSTGQVTNSGTVAALGNATVNAASVNSTGALGAGIDASGHASGSGSLSVSATGAVIATGQNLAGGNVALSGGSLNLAGATTTAGGNASLTATSGDITHTSGTLTANGTFTALASGTFNNDQGQISAGLIGITAGTLSNESATLASTQALTLTTGALDNTAGVIQAGGALNASAATVQNTAGRIVSASTGGLTLTATGQVTNTAGTTAQGAQGGVIGGNGNATLQASSLTNTGTITAGQTLSVTTSGALNNDQGTLTGTTLNANAASMTNAAGTISADTVTVTAPQLDNTSGRIVANQLALNATNLVNEQGTLTQLGSALMGLNVSGTLDNSDGGVLQTNSTNLTLAPASLNNDGGAISHAGTGLLTIDPANGSGTVSNVGGLIVTNGQANVTAASVDNTSGTLAAGSNLTLATTGALTNTGGQIGAGQQGGTSTLTVNAASVDNTDGALINGGTGDTTINGGSQITNSNAAGTSGKGVISGNGNIAVSATTISNTQGGQISGANLQLNSSALDNTAGSIGNLAGVAGNVAVTTGTLTGNGGRIGASQDLTVTANTLTGGLYSAVNDASIALQGNFTTSSADQFGAGHNLAFTLPGTFTNGGTFIAANNLGITAGNISNSGTMDAGGTLSTQSSTLTNTGTIVGASVTLSATQSILNQGPAALIGATDSAGTLALLAPTLTNIDSTTATDTAPTTAIYGLGAVVLAGGVDANDNYTNANQITNSSGLIQSGGDMTIAANQVTNTRTTMQTSYTTAVDPSVLTGLGISLAGCTAINMAACGPGNPNVGWTPVTDLAFLTMIGGAPISPPHTGQWNSGYQYTTYTGVATAYTVSAISPQGQIVSGGNLNAQTVNNLQNAWSAVTAVGNINIDNSHVDNTGWTNQIAPQVTVTYSGEYHYNNYDNSEHNWQLPFGNAGFVTGNPGGYSPAPADVITYALPAYESTFTSNGTISGTGVTINNTAGNAGIKPLGLLPGQSISGQQSVTGSMASNPVIAAATAGNVLNNISVPHGGLFNVDTAPNAPYLIQTNPAFTNQQNFLSSNYYFQLMGQNPSQIQQRLGDGFYEQQLVQQQILALTGKSVLTNYASTQAEYEALMTSGAQLAKSLDLAPGTGLSAAQVAALTSNVVIMQTQVVDGQSVLVPVVYLAKASQQNMGNGPVIAATNIDLENAQSITNSGTIAASNNLGISAQNIDSTNGTLQVGNQMALVSAGNVNLTSATVNAGTLGIQAGNNLILNTATQTLNQTAAGGATRSTTTLGPTASINVANNATIVTGGNFEQNAGNLNVGGALNASIGGNWTLGAQQASESKVVHGSNGVSDTSVVADTGSNVNVGGASQIAVGGDLTATGANINLGGGGTIAANGNVNLQASKATSTNNSNSSGSDSHGSYSDVTHTSDDVVTGTTLTSGNDLTIAAGKDLNVTGSTVNLTQGAATLAAQGNVNIGAATETHTSDLQSSGSHGSFVSRTSEASTSNTTETIADGSTISADAVNIQAGKDLNVQGSTVVGTNDVNLSAANNVNITTTQNTLQSNSSYQEHHSGIGTSGLSVTVGSSSQAQTSQQSSVTNNASEVGSLNGNLNITAGNTLHVTGSDLIAGQNVTGTAQDVIIDSATNTSNTSQTQQAHSSGLSVGLSGSVGDAINGAYQQSQAIGTSSNSGNGRATALHAIAAVGDAAIAEQGLFGGPMSGKSPSIGVQVSIGSSQSSSQSSETQTTQQGSNVTAGGTATFVATGTAPDSGNVNVAGSNITASDVVLAAQHQVNLTNTTNTDTTNSSNSSSGGSIGIGVEFGASGNGLEVSASASSAHGNGNSTTVTQNNTNVTGTNSVKIVSGGDTNIVGSDVSGNQVTANVGGNLNIQSVQDTTVANAHQSSVSGGFTISQGGGSASLSAQNGHADANYAGVSQQAGIQAGNGGFDVNVKGNTNLTGAYIASSATPDKNSLTTGTLTTSDIQNHSNYSANSNGLSVGAGVGGTGTAQGPGSISGAGGLTPMISQSDSGDQSSTTKSGISAGAITITDQANQAQALSTVNRDTTNLNGTVSNTPNIQNLLSQQADTMQAAQAAGQVVAQGIGAYADTKHQEALDSGDAAAAAAWAEGGSSRALLQAMGGALIGGLGGGSALSAAGGAVGAGTASYMAGQLGSIEKGVTSETGSSLLGNIAGNIVAGVGGALIGGSSGAAMASNVQLYNQSADDEAELTGDSGKRNPSLFQLGLQGLANALNLGLSLLGGGGGPPVGPSPVAISTGAVTLGLEQGVTAALPPNAIFSSGGNDNSASAGGSDNNASGAAAPISAGGVEATGPSSNVPPSILGANGNLPPGIGGKGTPIPMPASVDASATAEQFATAAFNGQNPVKVTNNVTGAGSWVAIMPDGTAITYRPAGQASALTDPGTATVEINSPSVRNINNGQVAKFKFPSN